MDLPRGFGPRIAYVRTREAMKQKELAEKLGITVRKLSDYETERSHPKDDFKIHIAKTLDVSLDFLFGLSDDYSSISNKKVIVLDKDYHTEDIAKVKEYADALMIARRSRKGK